MTSEKCPVCAKISVTLTRVHECIYNGIDYSYYHCMECGWLCNPKTIAILKELSVHLEPEVVYVLELINQNTITYGICVNCNTRATWSYFHQGARGTLHLFHCPDCNNSNIAGHCFDTEYYRKAKAKIMRYPIFE